MRLLQDKGSVEFALAIFYKTAKFRLAWQECRSRALLVELESVEPDTVHKVGSLACRQSPVAVANIWQPACMCSGRLLPHSCRGNANVNLRGCDIQPRTSMAEAQECWQRYHSTQPSVVLTRILTKFHPAVLGAAAMGGEPAPGGLALPA